MKLNFPILDNSIELENATIFTITCPEIFGQIICDLYTLDENSRLKLFMENQKRLTANDVLVVMDVMIYNANTTVFQKRLIKDIEEQLNMELDKKLEIEGMLGKLFTLVEDEFINHELDIEIKPLVVTQLIKAFQPCVILEESSIYEKMIDVVKIYSYLRNVTKLLIFVNSASFLSKDEYAQLIQFVELNNVKTLFLESRLVLDQPQYILDEDYYLQRISE